MNQHMPLNPLHELWTWVERTTKEVQLKIMDAMTEDVRVEVTVLRDELEIEEPVWLLAVLGLVYEGWLHLEPEERDEGPYQWLTRGPAADKYLLTPEEHGAAQHMATQGMPPPGYPAAFSQPVAACTAPGVPGFNPTFGHVPGGANNSSRGR